MSKKSQSQVPIPVKMNGKYPEWTVEGVIYRPYYPGNFWIDSTGTLAIGGYLDKHVNGITRVWPIDINNDKDSKPYVETMVKGERKVTYLEEAHRRVFPSMKWGGEKETSFDYNKPWWKQIPW